MYPAQNTDTQMFQNSTSTEYRYTQMFQNYNGTEYRHTQMYQNSTSKEQTHNKQTQNWSWTSAEEYVTVFVTLNLTIV